MSDGQVGYVAIMNKRGSTPYKYHDSKDCTHGPADPQEEPLSYLESDERFEKCTFCDEGHSGPTEQSHAHLQAAVKMDAEDVFDDRFHRIRMVYPISNGRGNHWYGDTGGDGAMTNTTPETKITAYQEVKDSGKDVTLRRQVAQELSVAPMTVHELTKKFPERSKNAIRPRVNELLRMGCARREGKRTNPSGNEAFVHHITSLGERYARGKADPDPQPTVAELRREALETARAFLRDEVGREELAIKVERVDAMQDRMNPEGGS